jgi:superfamily I DNA/RNA helicase
MTDDEMEAERKRCLDLILDSDAPLKVVVAGPGTGKTHTFRQVIAGSKGQVLVLSFLGNLVSDLQKTLGDSAEVKTFHGFCRKLLHSTDVPGITQGVDYLPAFPEVVAEDIQVLRRHAVSSEDLETAFMLMDDSDGLVASALAVGNYYNAVGHPDAVYRVYCVLRDSGGIELPYSDLLVDEYQDFCLLEVSLIEELSRRVPTLIVGDDDQALYGFKHASPDHLRDLVKRDDFRQFELPFCTRCTEVLVSATHKVVEVAQSKGLLKERVDKQYICYSPTKRAASDHYPALVHAYCTVQTSTAPYIARYIAQQIGAISPEDVVASRNEEQPTVLIVGPTQFGRQILRFLKELGVPNVRMRTSSSDSVDALAGYIRLLHDPSSRLGWRILLFVHRPAGWEEWVRRALESDEELVDLIDEEFRQRHLDIAELLGRLKNGEDLDQTELELLTKEVGLSLSELLVKLDLAPPPEDEEEVEDQPSVIITSLVGAKGLQAEHVFVVGMNEGHFPKINRAVTDEEVCCLLVALTRAKQSCTLVSCGRFGRDQVTPSVFLTWLNAFTRAVRVDSTYWQN